MNLKKLTEKELVNIINNTTDPDLLDKAETEYLNRMTVNNDELLASGFDELSDFEFDFMKKHWRPM